MQQTMQGDMGRRVGRSDKVEDVGEGERKERES
jgi:hypothetical protein